MRAAAGVAALAAVALALGADRLDAAVFEIQVADDMGEGYNDLSFRAPVGGNTGTTLGQQRLIATQAAADVWGAYLDSDVTIVISARFDPLPCMQLFAQLGMAGPRSLFRDFAGAPLAGTWYPSALADAVTGGNLAPGLPDINAIFSSAIDTGCFDGAPDGWYYGIDGNLPEGQAAFANTILHELAHGLGVSSTVVLSTGAKAQGFNDVFIRHLEDHETGRLYPDMSDAERLAASINTGNLHWVGPNARASGGFLQQGRVGDHIRMYAPDPQEPGSSVVHWDTDLEPSELMEPFFVEGSVRTLTEAMLIDIGWSVGGAPTFTPTATPTRSATRTATFTATVTRTATASRTGTVTPTPLPPTITATASRTATASSTPTITPTPPPGEPGDANCDNRRGAADVIAVVAAVGEGVFPCPGLDADDDGNIDADDVGATIAGIFAAN